MFLCLSIATLFSAYGLWAGQKWGKIITLATRAVRILFALGDVLNTFSIAAYLFATIFVMVYVVLSIVVVILVLRREPKNQNHGMIESATVTLHIALCKVAVAKNVL